MEGKLEAHYENRVYFFTIVSKKADEVAIMMYGTSYILVKVNGEWRNKIGNKMNLVPGLVDAVIVAANP
ncbi:hypothetical protein SAMN05421788_105254 [Filimonas lacunae]|uniref:Uncharacterized protein n=1 Tax=Filimonas lacunae TaxID=477680 RepID=A0A173MCN4_9BACT|nr:hypothetical protein [Filimonas lacunae]BAV05286.1 hypothetical protein FLA_1293 [Filimonas lacunae]SIT22191.1 hypothetical protein SAMN05421788_105254 [Filimonas lacunae]